MRFGTDGLRGPANSEITPELALRVGRAAARVIGVGTWFVARDTRRSGPMLVGAVAAGLAAEGVDVIDVGVLPTPAVALLAAGHSSAAAIMVSASHNPWPDNGLKVFGPGGLKLDDATQTSIEHELDSLTAVERDPTSVGDIAQSDRSSTYIDAIVTALDGRDLSGLHIVLDCGHGAASPVAGDIFAELGATVEVLHAEPDGRNINNDVGSTNTAQLSRRVAAAGADLGLAFDGDADRLIAVDGRGADVDGDRLLCLFALDMAAQGTLADDVLVVTVMSNLGLHRAMADAGVDVHVTPVGDRNVLEALARGGWSLGGEQSGHLVFADRATTGDGLLAGALLADLVKRSGRTLADLADTVMTTVPQLLVNVSTLVRPPDPASDMAAEIAEAEALLADSGRVLVRSSGTEPLVRVMVECESAELAHRVADNLCEVVVERYGARRD